MKKYICHNYNLQNLVSLNLDMTDLIILDWIYTFAYSGKMITYIQNDKTTQNQTTWYWISYKSMINDLKGLVSFESSRSLVRLLDKYQKANILTKKIVNHFTDTDQIIHHGTFSMVSINHDSYLYLLGEQSDYKGRFSNNTDDNTQPLPQLTTTSSQNSTPPIDNNVQPKIIMLKDNKATTIGTAVQNSVQKCNDGSVNVNNTDQIKNYIASLFNEKAYTLRYDFFCNLTDGFNKSGLLDFDLQKQYLKGMYDYCLSRGPVNLKSYFTNVVVRTEYMNRFMKNHDKDYTQQQLEDKSYTMICPACGHRHVKYQDCPNCFLHDPNDSEELEHCKNIAKLNPKDKALFTSNIQELYQSTGLDMEAIKQLPQKKQQIYQQFGV